MTSSVTDARRNEIYLLNRNALDVTYLMLIHAVVPGTINIEQNSKILLFFVETRRVEWLDRKY